MPDARGARLIREKVRCPAARHLLSAHVVTKASLVRVPSPDDHGFQGEPGRSELGALPLASSLISGWWDQHIQPGGPGQKSFCGLLPLAVGLRAFEAMEHLVTGISPGSTFVLAHERTCVSQRTDDASVAQ